MMPRIGAHGGACHRSGLARHEPEQPFLDHNDAEQNQQREDFGRGPRLAEVVQRFNRNPARDEQENSRNHRRRERFGLAVAVGMVLVRRFRRHDDAAPDDDGAENVRERFAGVGHERMGMARDARDQFCRREKDIHRQPGEGGAQAAFEAVGLHAKMKH